MSPKLDIINKTKGKIPVLPFEAVKNFAIGEDYELELIFVSEKESQEINKAHKEKDKPTNILSFPLNKNAGQIFICLPYEKKEAPDFGREYENYVMFLFIHGLVHLIGFDHGSRMESKEQKIREKFGI